MSQTSQVLGKKPMSALGQKQTFAPQKVTSALPSNTDRLALAHRSKHMAIYRLIANGSFGPDEIEVMTAAYEGALIDLQLSDRNDPITELIAKSIVNVTATGERDPIQIKERAINALGVRRIAAA